LSVSSPGSITAAAFVFSQPRIKQFAIIGPTTRDLMIKTAPFLPVPNKPVVVQRKSRLIGEPNNFRVFLRTTQNSLSREN
jgi:hypothetical protein